MQGPPADLSLLTQPSATQPVHSAAWARATQLEFPSSKHKVMTLRGKTISRKHALNVVHDTRAVLHRHFVYSPLMPVVVVMGECVYNGMVTSSWGQCDQSKAFTEISHLILPASEQRSQAPAGISCFRILLLRVNVNKEKAY